MIVNFLEIIVDLFLSRSFMINLETKIHLITKETISSCTTLAWSCWQGCPIVPGQRLYYFRSSPGPSFGRTSQQLRCHAAMDPNLVLWPCRPLDQHTMGVVARLSWLLMLGPHTAEFHTGEIMPSDSDGIMMHLQWLILVQHSWSWSMSKYSCGNQACLRQSIHCQNTNLKWQVPSTRDHCRWIEGTICHLLW